MNFLSFNGLTHFLSKVKGLIGAHNNDDNAHPDRFIETRSYISAVESDTVAIWVKLNKAVVDILALQSVPSGTPSFVYNCTGIADSTTIETIINDFFNNSTAMSMKMIVSDTMGVAFSDGFNAINISATNTRGAVCYLDFSDCNIPKITSLSMSFLNITSSTAKIICTGLVVETTHIGIIFNNASNNSFNNCSISSTRDKGIHIVNGGNNRFINCNISSSNLGAMTSGFTVHITTSINNNFINCNISGINFGGLTVQNNSNNNSFTQCNISSSGKAGNYDFNVIYIVNSSDNSFIDCNISRTGGTGGNGLYITNVNRNTVFVNCILYTPITGTFCIALANTFTGDISFIACKITGSYGVYSQAGSTDAIVRLIGCSIRGNGTVYDVYQSTAASTMTWYIMGNSFLYDRIYVNGVDKYASTSTIAAQCYMPAYANQFSRTIT